jgi:hypothetical protein
MGSETYGKRPAARAWAITRRAQRAHRRTSDRQHRDQRRQADRASRSDRTSRSPSHPRSGTRLPTPTDLLPLPAGSGDWRWWVGCAFGACCFAGKRRSPAPLTGRRDSPGPARGGDPYAGPYAEPDAEPYARGVRTPSPPGGRITAGHAPWGSGAAAPSGRPSAEAAFGGNPSLPWLPPRVMRHDPGHRPSTAGMIAHAHQGPGKVAKLCVLGGLPAGEQCEPGEDLTQAQLAQSERHGRTSSRDSTTDAKPHVNLGTTFPALQATSAACAGPLGADGGDRQAVRKRPAPQRQLARQRIGRLVHAIPFPLGARPQGRDHGSRPCRPSGPHARHPRRHAVP